MNPPEFRALVNIFRRRLLTVRGSQSAARFDVRQIFYRLRRRNVLIFDTN